MKNKLFLLVLAAFVLFSCENAINETPKQGQIETPTIPDPVDPAFWFGDIYTALIGRTPFTDSHLDIPDSSGVDSVSQIVNRKYICDAINAKWETAYTPESGTALQAANCEYFLKMVDKANGDKTKYGTGIYATTQVIDKTAVDDAVNALWSPDGKFVTVAYNSNKAAYSTDGIGWNPATLPSSANWYGVTYGNGTFVAVATSNSNKAAYSTNGINWTEATLPSSANWYGVTYGNGKFVAVTDSYSNKAAYSPDGVNWTATTLPSSAYWRGVTYGNGKFVAVAYDSNKAAYSPDGIDWIATTLPSRTYWYGVTYGNGMFVAVAYNSNKAAYSKDGINNWTAVTLLSSAYWYGVTYGNGKFVVVADSNKAAYSTNGIDWPLAILPRSAYWRGVTYGK
ncbi:hypothetical protein AGMMS49587_03450 [Spirochaetia bacterium]|nr:hypothetical protein AGMMS49587_03450 [Spirochaetia bacterium]